MKKIILSIAAVAALAACTKSEVQYEQTGEITLAPVTNTVTKSVAGYDYGASDNFHVGGKEGKFDGVFPTAIDLYVFANAGAEGSAANAHNEPYFRNAQFEWFTTSQKPNATNTQANGGAYAGNPTRYWPNVKTLVFAGYSDACGLSKTTPTMNFVDNVLTIPAYVQNNATYTAEGANDLMWFPRTTAYSKQTSEIVTNMKHACSWITVNVKGDNVTATYTEGDPAVIHTGWTLNSLVVKNIAHKGTTECGEESAVWYGLDNYSDEEYLATDETFTKDFAEYHKGTANNFIVIPQTPTTLEVTYSYVSDAANTITFTETKSISLDYDGVADANAAWQSGVHYIYNLTITATEILIDPVVVKWTENTPEIPAI